MADGGRRDLLLVGLGDVARGAVVTDYLKSAGYEPRPGTVAEAAEEKPLGVVLDISPFSDDGWGKLLDLKKNPVTREIPILPVFLAEEGAVGGVFPVAEFFMMPADPEYLPEKLTALGLTEEAEMYDLQAMVVSRKGDDNLTKYLRKLGFDVVNAYTGKEGFALASITPPYLVFSLLMLPDMSAFELLEKFRLFPQTRNVPFFILVKDSLKDGERKAVSREIAHLVRKKQLTREEFLSGLRRR